MEGKKRVVPREVCAERSERSNHSRKAMLNAQKSAEVVVVMQSESFDKGEGPNQ